jgi:hypothetical protein
MQDDKDPGLVLERTLHKPFDGYTCVNGREGPRHSRYAQYVPRSRPEVWHAPNRDFIHFSGKTKPWLKRVQETLNLDDILFRVHNGGQGIDSLSSPQELWYYTFWQVHERLQMGHKGYPDNIESVKATNDRSGSSSLDYYSVDIRNLNLPRPALGGYPTYGMMKAAIKARTGKSFDHMNTQAEATERNNTGNRT